MSVLARNGLLVSIFLLMQACGGSSTSDENINPVIDPPSPDAEQYAKPTGTYSSFVGNGLSLENEQAQGGLVRVKWSEIEPSNDSYDWNAIYEQVNAMDAYSSGKPWSLGIIAGKDSPTWLFDLGVTHFTIDFRGEPVEVPKFWDEQLQLHLDNLANAVAAEFGDDPRLVLVYVPQMTGNGIEGHFNGVPIETLTDAGLTAENWIAAVENAAINFAFAFTDKPIAVEVHEIMNDSSIPETIINNLWNNPALEQRVGAAMWWISGKDDYQSALVTILKNFPGDLYGQVIGRSDQVERFKDNNYLTVLEQAQELNMRYIEPWNFEFENHTFDSEFEEFNLWAKETFQE
ncbi:MAG: hypothetical protein COA86_07990 [Kangiella sp.]|nr:MAG: hypothetical protein COA86_07990 [Kangiella sp.]